MIKVALGFGLLVSMSSFAGSEIICKSSKYMMKVSLHSSGNPIGVNYGINGQENYMADVELRQFYKTNRALSMQFDVDGLPARFELVATRDKDKILKGRIFFDKEILGQFATCKEVKTK